MENSRITVDPKTTIASQSAKKKKFQAISFSEFNNPNDFEGWSCGKITTCGKHQICGGYNVKGTGSEIKKTFMLPVGTYMLELDFIKIDSWSV